MFTTSIASAAPLRVIYIMGCGRSGSTLLDTIISNHPSIIGLGELSFLSRPRWIDKAACSCGSPANRCHFWHDVIEQWLARTGLSTMHDYYALQTHIEEDSALPRMVRERWHQSDEFRRYATYTHALFATLSEVSGTTTTAVVDSSKSRMRALALAHIPGIDVRVIHLVRDVRGMAWSLKKAPKRRDRDSADAHALPMWHIGLGWTKINLLSEWVCQTLGTQRAGFYRYEDLVQQPRQSLERVGALIGYDMSGVADAIEQGQPLTIGHTIAGNPMRMSGAVRLRLDTAWMTHLTPQERLSLTLVAHWMMRRYRY